MRRALCLLALTACSQSPSRSAIVIDTLPGGVIQVTNHLPSDWADTNGWKLVLEHSIAPGDGEPGELINPNGIGVTGNGQIVVADPGGSGILVFNPDGGFDHLIGRVGNGPGEYSGQLFDIDVHGDTLGISDCNRARAILYLVDGTLLGQWHTHDCSGSTGILLDRGGAWIGEHLRYDGDSHAAMLRWLPDGSTVDTFLRPIAPPAHIWIGRDGSASPIPFSPRLASTLSPSRWWYGVGSSPTIVHLSPTGDTVRVVTLDLTPQPIPDSVRSATVARYLKDAALADVVHLENVPSAQPYFNALHLDERGRVWMARPGPDGSTTSFEVIDSSGRWLGSVPAPPGRSRDPLWCNGRMYHITQTDEGLPEVQVFRVEGGDEHPSRR